MSTAALLHAIDRFDTIRAIVIGDVMLDVYEYCFTAQSKLLSSEKEGKRAYRAQKAVKVLGGAGNVATNLSSLGVKTSLVGIAGNDDGYFKIRELCEKDGIRHFLVRDPSRPTTTKTRLYIDEEYVLRRDDELSHKVDGATAAALVREILHELPQSNVVILSDYNKGLFTRDLSREIMNECRTHSIPVVVDFKPVNALFFTNADVIAPNENEAIELLPGFSLDDLEKGTVELYNMLACRSVVVTLGKDGLSGFDGKSFFHVHGHSVVARDAVGCGDTVRACIGLGLSLGLTLKESVELANFAAAVIVQKPNTASIAATELREFIEQRTRD
jgi:rfaE bifunctional protein kinase chain/domain